MPFFTFQLIVLTHRC